MGSLGLTELLVIAAVALVVFGFGARKLPDIGKGLGEGIRNFKRAVRGDDDKDDPGKQ